MHAQKRKHSVLEKSPVSMLQESCDQENDALIFEQRSYEANPQMFACMVQAFDVVADGVGRSKKEAKQAGCANVISQLLKMNRFVRKLSPVTQTPHIRVDCDAIGSLMAICEKRRWPFAKFDVQRTGGEEHCPIFTAVCQLSSIKCSGSSSTTKIAKQIAARAVLDVVQNDMKNGNRSQLTVIESDPPKKLFRMFRELRKTTAIESTPLNLLDRHNFFLQLPEEDCNHARKVLLDETGIYGKTSKVKVDFACAALKIRYEIKDVGRSRSNYKNFSLQGDYDSYR